MHCIYKWLEVWNHHILSPFWRLYWNVQPGAYIYSEKVENGKRVDLLPDRVYLLPASCDYHCGLESPVGQYYIHFSLNAPDANHHLNGAVVEFPIDPVLAYLLELMVKGVETAPLRLVLEVLARLPEGDLKQSKISAKIEAAKTFLLDHIGEKPSLADLGNHVGMHPNAFSRLFKKATGWSPHAWLGRARIDEAEFLLERSDLSIEEIAEKLSFYDRYHFSRQFAYHRGVSPARYRRMKAEAGSAATGGVRKVTIRSSSQRQ